MDLKEKLINLKNKLTAYDPIDKGYEFDAELNDHPIPDYDIYRLCYVDYHRIGIGYGMSSFNVGLLYWHGDTFSLPEHMDRDDAFKVLSYLTDFIEKREDVEIGSLTSVRSLNKSLDLERFGFRKIKCGDNDGVVDLFTVDGRSLLFKRSSYYKRYFNWYTEGVTLEEVKEIYAKLGMEFKDIVWLDKPKVKVK